MFSSLPDSSPPRDAISERIKIHSVLNALETLCVHAQLFETLVVRLTTKLDLICVPSLSTTLPPIPDEEVEVQAAYAHWILTTLVKTLQKKVDRSDLDVAKYIERLVPSIFNLFIFVAFEASDEGVGDENESKERWRKRIRVATDPRLVKKAGEIITLIVQVLPLA